MEGSGDEGGNRLFDALLAGSAVPGITTVTKVGCADLEHLSEWCLAYGLPPHRIHHRQPFPHFDLIGPKQKEILLREGLRRHVERFKLV